jgi:hypothetical protein
MAHGSPRMKSRLAWSNGEARLLGHLAAQRGLPMTCLRPGADFGQAESRHRHDLDPAGQRLGRLAQQHG